jgi:ParB family chromosome partitioning protein
MEQTSNQQIPLDKIVIEENVRKHFDEEKIAGLSQSIRECGLQDPVHVLSLGDGTYSVVTGGRRLRAARKAGLSSLPAIVHHNLNRAEILVLQITENIQREDLTPIEKARGIDALMKETGWNASQTASKLGLTNGTVSKLLSCLSLSEALQQKIDSGELPLTAAYQLTQVNDVETRAKFAERVASGELNRDGLRRAIHTRKYSPRKRTPRPARVTAKLQSRETVSVSAPALDLSSFVSILEKLLNHAQQARTEGLTLQALMKRLAALRVPAIASGEAN